MTTLPRLAALARRAWAVWGEPLSYAVALAAVFLMAWGDHQSTLALYTVRYGAEEAARRMGELYIAAGALTGLLLQVPLIAAVLRHERANDQEEA